MDVDSWTTSYFEENTEYCHRLLQDREFLEQIPLLNEVAEYTALNDKIVRFKGMVQDMLNPVYYVEKLNVINRKTNMTSLRSGKYRDTIDLEGDEEIHHDFTEKLYQQKHIMHCVEVPGLNSWTKKCGYPDNQACSSFREGKRKLNGHHFVNSEMIDADYESTASNKRVSVVNIAETCNKKTEYNCNSDSTCSNDDKFLPLLTESNIVHNVLLNVYDYENNSLRVNDIVEVVGFLSMKSVFEDTKEDGMDYFASVPTIHVIQFVSSSSVFDTISQSRKEFIFENAESLRDDLWLMLTDILLGDTLAADYLICHLISTIYSHKNAVALGKFSLNMCNLPVELLDAGYVSSFYSFLSHLLEKSIYTPLSISYLNNTTMIPRKNNEENRLITGLLQVCSKTHIIIDETRLEPGTFVDKGIQNVKALSEIINSQKIEYDFEFYKLPFLTDIAVLTLSQGKSLLPSDYYIPLEPDESCTANVDELFARTWKKMENPFLYKLRIYLSIISSLDYDLTPSMRDVIERDYVEMRQQLNNHITSDDLHKLLVLSRYMSMSRGKKTLQNDVWKYACCMEKQRKARLR